MGPKKAKKEKKGKKGAAGGAGAGGDDADREKEAERLELVRQAKALLEMTRKEEQAFNEFQQQREKLNYFWIVEKKTFEDRKAELRNKERERQDLEEKHQVEIKVRSGRLDGGDGGDGRLTDARPTGGLAGVQAARETPAVRAPERDHGDQSR